MLITTFGSAIMGIEAISISVEVNVSTGKDYTIVGLPDSAVKESLLRIESAVKSIGKMMPRTKIVINLAPADIRKTGTAFDLPMAIGILAASGQIARTDALANMMFMGELGLDGAIRSIKGVLPMAILAAKENRAAFVVPKANAMEGAIVKNIAVYGMENLREVVDFLDGTKHFDVTPKPDVRAMFAQACDDYPLDFEDVRGQQNIKRALEIAAAGGHNVLLMGPPGAGKTMLAKRMPTILPPFTLHEALEVTKIYSVTGRLAADTTLLTRRPFRAPHHTVSDAALVGGGGIPQPGEISLAHTGVLFLDELPEFKKAVLEVLRQPLEEGRVNISRARMSVDFPANFMLIAAMNPCPCGYYTHPTRACTCPAGVPKKYLSKVSGPLFDRMDLHVEVVPVSQQDISTQTLGEKSELIRERVKKARDIQQVRFEDLAHIVTNADMDAARLRVHCALNEGAENLLKKAMDKLQLSARAYDRILKVARTIADLAGVEQIAAEHIAEAISFRSLDREKWGTM